MHFRTRNNVIQIIRTTYNPETKKPDNTIIGRLNKANPQIDQSLREKCTEEEISEIESWIGQELKIVHLKAEYAAITLSEQMTLAKECFKTCEDEAALRQIAPQIVQSWTQLRIIMKKKGLLE